VTLAATSPQLAAAKLIVRKRNIKPVHEATFTTCMEQLQEGYVYAIASTAGCTINRIDRDVNGLDVEFILSRGPHLEEVTIRAQLKSTTTQKLDLTKREFSFQFKERKHFDHLAKQRETVKAILLVLATDPNQTLWSSATHEVLSIQRCCYWVNLEGHPAKGNSVASPTVKVPMANVFDAAALRTMFERVLAGVPL
jgi:Uri superfamily endonuclease